MFPKCKITEPNLLEYINNVKSIDVRQTLDKVEQSFSDFLNLLSPAAMDYIPEIREKAKHVKSFHFGKTIRLYAPLYISNYCINSCEYCGFKNNMHFERKRLTMDEVLREARVIASYGIKSLLLVSGEDPKYIDVDFLASVVKELKNEFSYISIEIAPMSEGDYKALFDAGVHGLTLYQETYDRETYNKLHILGPKSDYDKRLEFVEGGARAGFYNIGLGALLGLYDWRIESVSMAAHAIYLKKKYWKTKIAFSFPRITQIAGGFSPPNELNEDELEQMMLAFRIFFKEADLYISTRETAEFRRKVLETSATHLSAASVVVPGGYYESSKDGSDLEQFSLNDTRSVHDIAEDIKLSGLEPVFKDWDTCLG
jgi:2-iminoacetate synthase